jgi:K+-transporting ATPase c subunit
MISTLRTSVLFILIMTLITGVFYPITVQLVGQGLFKYQTNGSLIVHSDKIIGSELIGQKFTGRGYFYSRSSYTGDGHERRVPVDLVTASASGIDPHISVAAAYYQISRIARERKISNYQVKELIDRNTERRLFWIFGEDRVNVLLLNLQLDDMMKNK